METITDAYQHYVDCCGTTEPPRSRDELRAYIHARNLRYEELDEEFWDEMFESRWGWGIDDNNECESCAVAGTRVLATTHSRNPDFAGYRLCNDCAREYDSR